jgi:ATP-dependent exoDNAse (exonuclease V) beta subunit
MVHSKYKLAVPTLEQKNIIDAFEEYNVMVNAVAGSGKTTTILNVVSSFPNETFLVLTYNQKLKEETRTKVKSLNLKNVVVENFNSFALNYYGCPFDNVTEAFTKQSIKKINFSSIIVDEAQDLTYIFFNLILKIVKDNQKIKPKFIVLGDEKQCIFDFMGSDPRFLTLANKIFPHNGLCWKNCGITVSQRITKKIADFINANFGFEYIKANKKLNEKPVEYFKINAWSQTVHIITNLIFKQKYKPDDIYVLAPSMNRGIVKKIANTIKENYENEINIYVADSDSEVVNDEIIKNKILFATYHKVKGLERKVIVVLNFDSSYYAYYKTNLDYKIFSNEHYVALTRTQELLIVIQNEKSEALFNLSEQKLDELEKSNIIVRYPKQTKLHNPLLCKNDLSENMEDNLKEEPNYTSVTNLVKFLPANVLFTCKSYLKISIVKGFSKRLELPDILEKDIIDQKTNEPVSSINSLAINKIFFEKRKYKHTLESAAEYQNFFKKNFDFVNKLVPKNSSEKQAQVWNALKEANFFICKTDSLKYPAFQVRKYNFCNIHEFFCGVERLDNIIPKNSSPKSTHIEYSIMFDFKNKFKPNSPLDNLHYKGFKGNIDILTSASCYELKCVHSIQDAHFIQLSLYMLACKATPSLCNIIKNFYLYNIKTDELLCVEASYNDLIKILEEILIYKYFRDDSENDERFIAKTKSLMIE